MLKGDVSKVSMVDYGCSWGYMSYQFKQKVHQLQSFEISVPRATYGNKNLGLNIVSNEDELQPQVDIFFSSHVIEHVPSLQNLINLAKKMVKPGGYIITLCPNGSDHYQIKEPTSFHLAWGKVHPNYLSDSFFKKAFKDNPKYIGTTPIQFEHIEKWDKQSILIDNLDNIEMLTIVKV
jgi:cyclopropane fatty-acyl-phospholipid synthase-like methyltransferase